MEADSFAYLKALAREESTSENAHPGTKLYNPNIT